MSIAKERSASHHAENFSLADFLHFEGDTLLDRTGKFSAYYHQSLNDGSALYRREILSRPGRSVRVRDPRDGKVQDMLMFGANDYLGLAADPQVVAAVAEAIQTFGVGMGGPPLLNGRNSLHSQLEQELARFKHQDDCLLFVSGFQANLGWVQALVRAGDHLIFDDLNHASFYDAVKMNRATQRFRAIRFAHNDLLELERHLQDAFAKKAASSQVFVMVEGVYSMDGDLAPLDAIVRLKRKFDFILVVDDAHGTGVMGAMGSGTAEYFGVENEVDISIGTFSKAFGVSGGFIAAKRPIIDYLRFFSRSYLFSAHLPQALVAAVRAGLNVIQTQPERVQRLRENVCYLEQAFQAMDLDVASPSAILPVRVHEETDIRALNRFLHDAGIFVNSVEFPAVPLDEQRIRVSVMATHTRDDLEKCRSVFAEALPRFAFRRRNRSA